MIKAKIILGIFKVFMWIGILGLGVWYLSSSLGGAAITYTSVDNFLIAAGVENGDISSANGCALCKYITDLFSVLGRATEMFWSAMLDSLWIIIVIGFGIFVIIEAIKHLFEAAKQTTKDEQTEKKLEFKAWAEKIIKQGTRVAIIGVLIGALGMGGVGALKTVSNITITPVMYLGAELSLAASGTGAATQCRALEATENLEQSSNGTDFLNPILSPFLCVIGNINSVMLAGAAGGFSMMNYAALDMGGGALTWLAGLGLVLMFLVIGFDLFFQILSVVFKLIFIVIFMPLLLAAAAFEKTWSFANGLVDKAINMLVSSAVRIVAITLKVIIIFGTVSYAADSYFPGPVDGYSVVIPPLLTNEAPENPDTKTLSVLNVFSTCESVSLVDGVVDKDKFTNCFTARKAEVERKYPDAFDFLENGWDFLVMMGFIFALYFLVINQKVDKILGGGDKEMFDYGGWLRGLTTTTLKSPMKIAEWATGKFIKK